MINVDYELGEYVRCSGYGPISELINQEPNVVYHFLRYKT